MMVPAPFRTETLRRVLDDPHRKPMTQIASEALAFGLRKREVPRQYFRSMLYRRHVEDPHGYMTHRQYWRLRKLTERPELLPTLQDKMRFQKFFETVPGVRLPHWLGHTDGPTFYAHDGTRVYLASREDWARALGAALERAKSRGAESLFAKPRTAYGGRGVERIESLEEGAGLWRAASGKGYVLQQTVRQHEALSAVYPFSLNTLRITTCRRDGAPAAVSSAWIRFGQGGHWVDNGSSGGFFSGVDLESGRIEGFGTRMLGLGGHTYIEHPDTGHSLLGYLVPFFSEALAMARTAADALSYPLVGWDVAIAPDGPVLIEGNHNPDYHYDEVANGGYLNHPVLGPFIDDLTGGRGL